MSAIFLTCRRQWKPLLHYRIWTTVLNQPRSPPEAGPFFIEYTGSGHSPPALQFIFPETVMIVLNNITRYYGHVAAVDNLTLEVPRGEILGFLGPNGAGKTTT